jgi:hypothetical protein
LFVDASGNVGIGAAPALVAYRFDIQGGGQRILNQGGVSSLEIGNGTTTSQTAYVDLVTDTTYTDFGLRLLRDGGANAVSQLTHRGTGELKFNAQDAAPLTFLTTNTERARIDSSGRLLVGTSTSISSSVYVSSYSAAISSRLQIAGTTVDAASVSIQNYQNFGGANPGISLCKSNSGTVGTFTATLASGNSLGAIVFNGDDSAKFVAGAAIEALVDGTPGTNDMPGRLVFSTTADGAASPTERLRITSAGNVGIGTTSPSSTLEVNGSIVIGTGAATYLAGVIGYSDSNWGSLNRPPRVGGIAAYGFQSFAGVTRMAISDTGTTSLTSAAATPPFIANIAASEAARIDSSGRLLVGTSSGRQIAFGQALHQVEGTSSNGFSSITVTDNTAFGGAFVLAKTRGAAFQVLSSGDNLGILSFQGADGSALKEAARITALVDGTPGTDDMPGRLVFSTTPDGSATSTERLRITSAGVLQIFEAGNIAVGTTTGTKIGTATTQKLGFYNATPVVQPAAVADATTAVDVITQLNALLAKLRTLGIIAT